MESNALFTVRFRLNTLLTTMPGPRNSIKKKKQKRKGKPKSNGDCTKAVDSEQNNPKSDPVPATIKEENHIVVNNDKITKKTDRNSTVIESYPSEIRTQKPDHYQSEDTVSAISAVSALNTPFVTDGGDGPRVKDIEKYLSSFFCPPVSLDNHDCARYDRVEILTVLKSTLPHEFALVSNLDLITKSILNYMNYQKNVWFNKSRTFNRICPACQRLYRLGDSLLDPVNGGMLCIEDPNTPYQVLREQRISGICMHSTSNGSKYILLTRILRLNALFSTGLLFFISIHNGSSLRILGSPS